MRLKSITSQNYRTLQNLTLTFSNNYCTISGRNNAGKSCVIRLLSALFLRGRRFWLDGIGLDHKEDKTQWIKDDVPIEIEFVLEVTGEEDPALISFIEKIASRTISESSTLLKIGMSVSDDEEHVAVEVGSEKVDDKAAKEIVKRIKDSNLLFLYNSTRRHDLFGRRGGRMFYDFVMSAAERKQLETAGKHIERRLRKLAKDHTAGLSKILGRLTEKYEVELSPLEGLGFAEPEMPLGISLKDKNVEVPLSDWGSGTQNRTHILMAVLQANRIKTTGSPDEKITPIVVIEEPESFLHPSAQAEFGRMLRHLSDELGIQILVTTHSPHMLNQEQPAANILLSRELRRNKMFESVRIDTSGDNWMSPFVDHLGIGAKEFSNLKPLFSADKSKVLLVEGIIDQEYFQFLQQHSVGCESLASCIEVVPYGGKDTLKHTSLMQFVLKKFDQVFVTYDLDAENEIAGALARLGLKKGQNCLPLGIPQAGKDCIEGLLPPGIVAAVTSRETDLVLRLGSRSNEDRKSAKNAFKKHYLTEFKSRSSHSKEELRELGKVIRVINSRLVGK